MITFYDNPEQARADAAARGLREKVLCFVVRSERLLVFEHVPDGGSGVQLPAGGLEPGETPRQAAVRELREESGLSLDNPVCLASYRWEAQLPERFTRQVCHAYAFAAPAGLPDTWDHAADGHLFRFRWAPLDGPGLDWEMDAALPQLLRRLPTEKPEISGHELPLADALALAAREGLRQKVRVYVTRGDDLLVFEEHAGCPELPAGGVEPGEHPADAATREVFEESGLALSDPVHLASYHWTVEERSKVWHCYWLIAPADTPDGWTHVVTGGDKDDGQRFALRFTPLEKPDLIPGHRFEEALPRLRNLIRQENP